MSERSDRRRSLLIKGVTEDGRLFRPSDWAERLAEVIALFLRERLGAHVSARAASYAVPCVEARVKCLMLDPALDALCPPAFEFVMRFAGDNGLPIVRCDAERSAA